MARVTRLAARVALAPSLWAAGLTRCGRLRRRQTPSTPGETEVGATTQRCEGCNGPMNAVQPGRAWCPRLTPGLLGSTGTNRATAGDLHRREVMRPPRGRRGSYESHRVLWRLRPRRAAPPRHERASLLLPLPDERGACQAC